MAAKIKCQNFLNQTIFSKSCYTFFKEIMTIGFEKIYLKYYAQKMSKRIFQKIIKLDPTSIVKKDNMKPGKYCKWLVQQFFKNNFQDFDKEIIITEKNIKISDKTNQSIFDALHMYHRWYKRTYRKKSDIFKFKDLRSMINEMKYRHEEFESHNKYHNKNVDKIYIIYEDENIKVLEPLNFAACYNYSKHSEWCSKSESSYNSWKSENILLRFVDKRHKRIHRLTWSYTHTTDWSWAMPVYPEFGICLLKNSSMRTDPFQFHLFKITKSEYTSAESHNDTLKRYSELEDLFKFINKECIKDLYNYYNLKIKERFEKAEHDKKMMEILRETESRSHFESYVHY